MLYLIRFFIIISSIYVCCCGRDSVDIDLSGEWDLVISDKDHFDDINFSNGKQKCLIPGYWMELVKQNPEYMSYIWLVKEITIPESLKNEPLILYLGKIALSDRTFFNNIEIGATGYMPTQEKPFDYGFNIMQFRKYYIPSNLVKYGKKNIISVQVFSHILNGFANSPYITTQNNWEKSVHLQNDWQILQNLGFFPVNMLFLVILIYILKKDKRYPLIINLSLFVLIQVLVHFLILGIPFFVNGLLRYKIILILYLFGALFTYLILRNFFFRRINVLFYMFILYAFVCTTVIIYSPDTNYFITKGVSFFAGFLFLSILIICVSLLRRVIKNPVKYYYLLLIVMLLIVLLGDSLLVIFTLKISHMHVLFYLFAPVILISTIMNVIFNNKKNSMNVTALNKISESIGKQKNNLKQMEIINDIARHLDDNYRDFYNRLKLAEQFNIHDNYMVQLFKKTTGTTISSYINTRRIQAAVKLIEEDESKIIDIAYHVGFDNLTHFYRQFKKKTGMTPNELRSTLKRKNKIDT